jgi:phenylalanyl-tRNA synthetase beta chain
MRVPLKWLADYVDLRLPTKELAHRLTMSGNEVGAILSTGGDWDLISVAQVVAVERHPNADRLTLTTVNLGGGERMTWIGAPNVAAGQKVFAARAPADRRPTGELSVPCRTIGSAAWSVGEGLGLFSRKASELPKRPWAFPKSGGDHLT